MRSRRTANAWAHTQPMRSRTSSAAGQSQRSGVERTRLIASASTSSRRGGAEADFGSFALRRRRDFKEFARPEAQHVGKNVGGELLNFGVQVANHGVVVAAGVLDGVFNFGKGVLQGRK